MKYLEYPRNNMRIIEEEVRYRKEMNCKCLACKPKWNVPLEKRIVRGRAPQRAELATRGFERATRTHTTTKPDARMWKRKEGMKIVIRRGRRKWRERKRGGGASLRKETMEYGGAEGSIRKIMETWRTISSKGCDSTANRVYRKAAIVVRFHFGWKKQKERKD